VAGQPKPTCYIEGISLTKQAIHAVGYISDSKEIITAFWSNFQYDGVAAFTLSQSSPLPPALSERDLLEGQTQLLNVH
jgi:hypothetical protein